MSQYNNQKLGSNGFNWWIGQIEDDKVWKSNQVGEKWVDPNKIAGYGARYKVRIIGKHSPDRRNLPADSLEMCEVMYPVTGGSGHAASFQTSNLRTGSFVIGFYKDGIDGQEPIIMGCLGNNDQTKLATTFTSKGFIPTSGFSSDWVPPYAIPPGGSGPQTGPECIEGTGANRETEACRIQQDQGKQESNFLSPESCKQQLNGVQSEIKKFIQSIQDLRNKTKNWSYWIRQKGSSIVSDIRTFAERAAKAISGWIKNMLGKIREFVITKINNAIKDLYYLLFPKQEKKLHEAHKKALSGISCLFNKIIKNLLNIIVNLLLQIVDKFINAPLCAIEHIIASLLGKLMGLIEATIFKSIEEIVAIVGGVIDLASDLLGMVPNILGMFLCDEESNCPEVTKWSTWGGASSKNSLDFTVIFEKAKSIASTSQQIVDPNNYDFDLDFSDIFDDVCNVGPLLCGPPTVDFFGGGGSGTTANAIIDATGQILGVDIITSGSNYTSAPTVKFIDACGNGSGAVGTSNIGVISPGIIGVTGVTIERTGTGYLPSPDGSQGGDGRTWANADNTTVKRADSSYDTPYDPGETFPVYPGDLVKEPGKNGIMITKDEVRTAPAYDKNDISNLRGTYPNTDTGSYPVILYICGITISNTGVNYATTDKIVVEPANGAILEPTFGPFGALIDIKIIQPGSGFKERPKIYIETESGYNVEIIPTLCVQRIGDLTQDQDKIPSQEKIIDVIDCVGKV